VLIHSDVLLNRSLSHCVSQENHLEYHIVSTLYTEENSKPITWAPSPLTGVHIVSSPSQRERHTQLMGFFTPHRGTQRSISVSERNDTPISWAHPTHGLPHPTQGHTTFHLRLREEQHTHLMGTPNSWALSQADSLSLCPGGCLTLCNHQHSLSAREAFSIRPTQGSLIGRSLRPSLSQSCNCNHQHSLSAREVFSTRPSLSRKYSNFVLASGLVKISAICSWVGRYCTCTAFLCTMSLI
jgi:hypothetical protein